MAIPGGNAPTAQKLRVCASIVRDHLASEKGFFKKNKHHILLACEPTAKTSQLIQNTEKFAPHTKKYPGKLPFRPVTHNSIRLLRE